MPIRGLTVSVDAQLVSAENVDFVLWDNCPAVDRRSGRGKRIIERNNDQRKISHYRMLITGSKRDPNIARIATQHPTSQWLIKKPIFEGDLLLIVAYPFIVNLNNKLKSHHGRYLVREGIYSVCCKNCLDFK